MDKNERQLILESTNYQLMYVLKEIVENKLNENTVNYLEEEYEELSKIDLNTVDDEIFVANAKRTLKLAAETIQKYKECKDNVTLVKSTVYITPKHLHSLDILADTQMFKGKGRRSQALRYVLNGYFSLD